MIRIGPALLLVLAALSGCAQPTGQTVEVNVHYSHFGPSAVTVRAGVPTTIVLRNDDPIDHEWIVGDEQVHAFHRTGTELLHADRPTEVTLPALSTRTTTITFDKPGQLLYICHLPGHEAYGMVGTLTVVP
jgi:uncharacterized cupredoxin-like copper-binding protein